MGSAIGQCKIYIVESLKIVLKFFVINDIFAPISSLRWIRLTIVFFIVLA